ncbi:hypothetical protein E7V67_013255 [[Empedobacter] haloabium]|uniref:Core-binding (CB) domain-containing protein n=1 Tax=[Empedobacter] haloabium TaxID=592317 RepID=A0ABZ1UTM4_9BURK
MRQAAARAGAPIDGIAWLGEWEWPFEGGYTLMSKLSWANGLGGSELCRAVFGRNLVMSNNAGRHGRSLLDMGWVEAGGSLGIPYLRDKAIEGTLVSRAGRWTHLLASDSAFRYCPECLAHGYQSALYQIEGIAACPIHNVPLHVRCRHCGAITQRYAITGPGFETPFHCATCLAPLGSTFSPAAWEDAALRHAAYTQLEPIARWLEQLAATTLQWNRWDQWHFPLRWHSSDVERHRATFQILARAVALPDEFALPTTSTHTANLYLGALAEPLKSRAPPETGARDAQTERDRVTLYKAVRRYLKRRLQGCKRVVIGHLADEIAVSTFDSTMQLSAVACPRAQALTLWRIHFEVLQPDLHALTLRPSALYWPAGVAIDDAAWAAYSLASFHAAVRAFDAWRDLALTLADADLLGQDRARARALHARFAPLLAPSILPTFPAVTSLTFTDDDGRSRLFIVGPPDTDASLCGPSQGHLWCSCGNVSKHHHCGAAAKGTSVARTPVAPAAQRTAENINLAYFLPMDQLWLPPALDGSVPRRAPSKWPCLLDAKNDMAALSSWLDTCKSATTRRAYTQEVEKVLVWCVAQRGIALSDMTTNDAKAFETFLAAPAPPDVWLPSHTPGAPRRWSPFRKVPSETTQRRTIGILALLFKYWAGKGYIALSPWYSRERNVDVAQRHGEGVRCSPSRETLLTLDEWAYLASAATASEEDVAACIVLYLAYYSGLRRSEILHIQAKDLHRAVLSAQGTEIWSVDIQQRPEQRRRVYLMPDLVAILSSVVPVEISEFSAFIARCPDDYLVTMLGRMPRAGPANAAPVVTGEAISLWLKPMFVRAAQLAEQTGDGIAAQRLRKASLFWISGSLERHLKVLDKGTLDCWLVVGACSLYPPLLVPLLPGRQALGPAEITDAMSRLSAVLSDTRLTRTIGSERLSQSA